MSRLCSHYIKRALERRDYETVRFPTIFRRSLYRICCRPMRFFEEQEVLVLRRRGSLAFGTRKRALKQSNSHVPQALEVAHSVWVNRRRRQCLTRDPNVL